MDRCPCGRSIEDWEAVCKYCWGILGKHDKVYGSAFQHMVVQRFKSIHRRDVVDQRMIEALRRRMTPRRTRRIRSLRERMKEYCKTCEDEHGQKGVAECFECSFHILINDMFQEILSNCH